jgi:hypothetical protein
VTQDDPWVTKEDPRVTPTNFYYRNNKSKKAKNPPPNCGKLIRDCLLLNNLKNKKAKNPPPAKFLNMFNP